MTPYDAVMVGVIIAGMVWGAWRGITWQLASLASLVLGYSVAHPLSGQFAPQFPGPPIVARALSMLLIYAAVSGGIFLCAWLVRATLRRFQFEAFDRHLGLILGGIEGGFLGLVGTIFVISLLPQTRGTIFESPTGRVVCQVIQVLGPVLPSEIRAELVPFGTAAGTPDATPPGARPDPEPAADLAGSAVPAQGARNPLDPEVSKVRGLLDQAESRVGRAIIDSAAKELGERGGLNGRDVERR